MVTTACPTVLSSFLASLDGESTNLLTYSMEQGHSWEAS